MNLSKIKKNIYVIMGIVFVSILCFYVALKTNVVTGKAVLQWEENKEPNIAGYKIYYGTEPRKSDTPQESGYTETLDAGREHIYTCNNLNVFTTYYFSTTAYNEKGVESGFSQEVSKKITLIDIF